MKAKRLISFVLAAAFMLSAAATPVFAAAALPQQTAAVEQENGIVSIRIKATGNLVYGSDYKLEVQTTPADTQYIGNRIAKFLADYRKRHPGKKTFPEDSVQPKSKEEIARQAALAEAKDPA